MVGIMSGIVVVLIVVTPILWGYTRFQKAGQVPRTIDPTAMPNLVRVDLDALRSIPTIAPTLDRVKWSKFRKERGGTVAGGELVFGPQRLTWAPDDSSRRLGTASWQVSWSDVAGAELRAATTTSSTALVLTLVGGQSIEMTGVDPVRAQAAIDKFVKPRMP